MQFLAFLALLTFGGLPSADASNSQRVLMDQIERAVVLPKGARPLAAYGRNYAYESPSVVMATYLVPNPPPNRDGECESMITDSPSRRCSPEELAKLQASDEMAYAGQTPPGQRRWFTSVRELPMIYDGGCLQITLRYDLLARRVLWVRCNGFA